MDGTPGSGDVAALLAEVRRFVDEEVIPVERDALHPDHRDVLERLMTTAKDRGLWALGHPAAIGGGGLELVDDIALNEVVGRSTPAAAAMGEHSVQDTLLLRRHARPALQERWLAPIVAGEAFVSIAMTEPEVAGSDPKLIRTTAHEERGGWSINGHKWFIGWADRASIVIVIAKTDPVAALRRQFSAFLVPTDTPGFELVRLLSVMGDDLSHHGELRFTAAWVDGEHLLGERGDGFAIAQEWLGRGRLVDAARWLGQAERAFELMCAATHETFAHGSRLSEKSDVQRIVAESAAQIHATRLVVMDAARAMAAGDDVRVRTSIARILGSRMLHDVIDRAIQIHGAAGLSGDLPLERMYREARRARIHDGPDEIHRMIVARSLLEADSAQLPW